ncbi:MAG: (2Fe-2S)-binding protein [Pseudomonadota bacterium]
MAAPEAIRHQSPWADRFAQLLDQSGLNRTTVLSQALHDSPPERAGLFSLAQCLQQPSLLIKQVGADYPHATTPRAVRAQISVLQQDLALSVLAPLTLRLFHDGRAPLPAPERIFLAPVDRRGEATSRWFQLPGGTGVDEATFVAGLGTLTSDWYPVFRQKLGVSPGAYWSSIGLGLGAPFSAVWNLAQPQPLCDLAQRWLNQFANDANQFIDWIPAVFGGQTTAIPQRKGCCLKYLLPEGGYCGTCGVYRKERMAVLRCQPPGQWRPGQ